MNRALAGGVAAAVLALAGLVRGAGAQVEDATPSPPAAPEELLARAFHNLYADDYIQLMELSTEPRGGHGMTRRLQITRKQSITPGKALLRFLEPYDIRHTSILILEKRRAADDLYVYLPATRLTRRLSAAQRADAFFGTDLSYEDIEPKYVEDWEVRRIGHGELDGLPCELLEIRARETFESMYDHLESCIEAERGLILWTDFHRGGAAFKRLEIAPDTVKAIGTRFIPFEMTFSTLKRGSATQVLTESYEISPLIPDNLFTTWNLQAGDAKRDRARAIPKAK